MLYLTFHLGPERYALASQSIERVLPMVHLKNLPHAPPYLRGLLNYHRAIVPVIDLCALVSGQEARVRLSTRIILARYPSHEENSHRLGLLAEKVTDTIQLADGDLLPTGVNVENAAYLGKVASTPEGLVQIVEVDHILPPSLKGRLFQAEAGIERKP